VKKINYRVSVVGRKTIRRTSLKRAKINRKMVQGRVVTSQPLLRQSREEITNMKEYQNLMNLLK